VVDEWILRTPLRAVGSNFEIVARPSGRSA
jgi:hypothetical protein